MTTGLGKQAIIIGSGENCDIRIGGPGVAAEHARIERQADGSLIFVDNAAGQSLVNGALVQPGSSVPFDFRTQVFLAQTPLPLTHPALALMLLQKGNLPVEPGSIVFGRDPAQCHVVVLNQSVSSRHAALTVNPLSVVDLGSSQGTWLGQVRLQPHQAHALDPSLVIAIGPIPLPVQLVPWLANEIGATPPQPAGAGEASPAAAAAGGPAGEAPAAAPRKKHKTVIGQVALTQAEGRPYKSIGRTPDNDIVLSHPQVSSKHAILHNDNGKLFLEDRGSSNGTYVRGQRIPAGQRVPVASGEKVFIGPMKTFSPLSTGTRCPAGMRCPRT